MNNNLSQENVINIITELLESMNLYIKLKASPTNLKRKIHGNDGSNGRVKVSYEDDAVIITGNKLGLMYLIYRIGLIIKNSDDVDHFHLDDLNGADEGSIELIIEKSD